MCAQRLKRDTEIGAAGLARLFSRGKRPTISPEAAEKLPRLHVNVSLLFDVENIANGLYSPLTKFMGSEDYTSVLNRGRLANDEPWSIPIVLDMNNSDISGIREGEMVALSLVQGEVHSTVGVEEIFSYDKKEFCKRVYGTDNANHPGVLRTIEMGDTLIAGSVKVLRPLRTEFDKYTLSPAETKSAFREKGWKQVVAFQTRNVPHMGHEALQKAALTFADGIFINPLVGPKKPGDFKDEVILATYEALIKSYYPKDRVVLGKENLPSDLVRREVVETIRRYDNPLVE